MSTSLNPYQTYILRRNWAITHNTWEFYEHWHKRMVIYNKLANLVKKRTVIN